MKHVKFLEFGRVDAERMFSWQDNLELGEHSQKLSARHSGWMRGQIMSSKG